MEVLNWDEPRDYRRSENLRSQKPFGAEAFKSFSIVVGCLLLLRGAVALNPKPKNPPIAWGPMVGLAIGVGFVACFVGPWIISALGFARVLISPKGVNHNSLRGFGWRIEHFPWTSISSTAVTTEGGRRFLTLHLVDGRKPRFAVAPGVSDAQIRNYCKTFGVDMA